MVKKVKLRILFLLAIILSAILSVFLILKSLEKDVVFFLSPTDVKVLKIIDTKKIRVGGMVKDKSISISSEKINFVITYICFKQFSDFQTLAAGSAPSLGAQNFEK